MIVQCCVCKKIRQGDEWLILPITDEKRVSHGYCPVCAKKAWAQLQKEEEENDRGP